VLDNKKWRLDVNSHSDGELLNQYITDVLNDIIMSTGKAIDKDNPKIWDGFLHQLTNAEWELMFKAFLDTVANKALLLTYHQQQKFDEAYMTFNKDKLKREQCMDIRNRFMNTKTLAWGMIMTIREVYNLANGKNIANQDQPKPAEPKPQPPGRRRRINIHATIEIWEDLFDVK
jgi:hypothetical protein